MGNPEMEGAALREMVTTPLHPLEEGRVENLLFSFISVLLQAIQPGVPKFSKKEHLYLWVPRGHGEQWTVQNCTTLILL